LLGQTEGKRKRKRSSPCENDQPGIHVSVNPPGQEEEERPGCAKSKEGQADDHVGEVIPEADGKQPHQEDFISKDRGGSAEEKDGVM
jgi:hypothetical protein